MSRRTLRTKLWRDLRQQWPQFAAITVTVLLGVALFAASYDAFRNLEASYDNLHVQLDSAHLWISGGDTSAIARDARATDGVTEVVTRIQADVPIRVGEDKLRGRVVSVPAEAAAAVNGLLVLEGDRQLSGPRALVEQHMASHFGLAPGDRVEVLRPGTDQRILLDVAGSAASAEYIWPARSRQEIITFPDDFGVLFVSEDAARTLTGMEPNQVVLRVAEEEDQALLDSLEQAAVEAGATSVLTREEQPSNATLQEDLDGFSELSVAFPALFLTAAGMAAYVLITRRVRSEQRLIGMLLANGVRRRAVLSHYLAFGLAAGALGAVVGVAGGMAGARAMTRLYLDVIGLPAQVAVLDVRPDTFFAGVAFGLVAGGLSALPAALGAARLDPATAMHGVAPVTGGHRSLAERLLPPLRRLPTRWRLVLRGIGRNRRRTASTVLGVTLSLLLILASWLMLDTFDGLLDRQFGQVQRQDARVEFAGPQDRTVLQALADVDGVERVEPVVAAPVAIRGPDGSYGSLLLALPRDTRMHGFYLAGGEETSLPDAGVLVGRAARQEIGVAPGETATLAIEALGTTVPVTVEGYVDEPLGTQVYAAIDAIEAAAGGPVPVTSALLAFADGADRDAIRRTVRDLPMVAAYEDAQALAALFDDFTGLFYGFIGAMLALGALMAFAIMFTTMSVNIVERSREVATLRASGVGRGQVARLISAENLLVTLAGVVPGLVVGVIGGRILMDSYSSDLFRLDLIVRPRTLVLAALAIVAVAALSQWPSLRAVGRLDIAEAVRERDT